MYDSSVVAAATSKLCFCIDCINAYTIIAQVDKAMLLINMLHGLSNFPTAVCINQVAYFLNGKLNPPPNCIDGDDDGDLGDGNLGDGELGDGELGDGELGDGELVLNVFAFSNMAIYASTTSFMLSSHL